MENTKVNIFVVDHKKNTYVLEVPENMTYLEFTNLITKKISTINELRNYHAIFKEKNFNKNSFIEKMHFENEDRVIIINERQDESFNIKFHTNVNLNDSDMKIGKLTGLLRLILIKYISNFIKDINMIKSNDIKEIVSELKEGIKLEESAEKDIQSNLNDKSGSDIIAYSNYVSAIIKDQDIDDLMELIDKNLQNQIYKYWSILTKYEDFNQDFEVDLLKAIETSYFDYSLIGLSIYEQTNKNQYLESMKLCQNTIKKYLFHGTQIGPISSIITSGFFYSRKPFYGMGVYFSDMLDYVSFYSGGDNLDNRRANFGKILPINSTFSCVGAEVFYNKLLLKKIYDFTLNVKELDHFPTYEEIKKEYKDYMIKKHGVHYARVEPNQGQVRNQEDIIKDKKEGRFIGTEYAITEMEQILPLYGLTFKRKEYFVIWRDPNFQGDNPFSDYLRERKLFIYKYAKMNAYFESSTEKALEIIKKKKFNKIILISSIGLDLSGKKFVEIARQILGFDVVVLFFSKNHNHFSWLQNFPNALYTDDATFYKDYILNYNEKGLLTLKDKIEKCYRINLKFTANFMKFPKFIDGNELFENIIFEEPSPNFKKVIIINSESDKVFCMDDKQNPSFNSSSQLNVNLYEWYVTMIGNEITFYSNGSYLGADENKGKAKGEPFMKRYNYEKIDNMEYIFYYENKNNILTIKGNNAILQKENYNRTNQKFKLLEITESESS